MKQGTTLRSINTSTLTSKANTIQETVKYQYVKVEIGMPVFMNDIAVVGAANKIRKEMQNCIRIDI